MTTDNDDSPTLRIAVLGGMVLLAWLLWRGRGTGSGPQDGDRGAPTPVEIWLRPDDGLELGGVPSDLPTAIARARVAGEVRLHVPGDVRHGWVETVAGALRAAGAEVGMIDPSYTGSDVVVFDPSFAG